MAEILHLWALAPAAVGTCCMAADRRRVRAPELAASALMLLAMIDLVRAAPLLAPVVWAALLLAAAMVLAGVRGGQLRRASGMPATRLPTICMTLSTAGGMVLMAALVMMMGAHAAASPAAAMSGMAGMHSGDAGGLRALVAFMALAYAAASGVAAVRAHTRLDRAQFVAMGASTAIMTLAVIV